MTVKKVSIESKSIKASKTSKPEKPKKISTIEIEESLARYFNFKVNVIVPNISWGLGVHECDIFVIRQSNYAIEVEIKISLSDLKAESKKGHTHSSTKIREFYYAIPNDLLDSCIEHIPPHAGILTCERNKYNDIVKTNIYRKAKINTKARKLTDKEVLKACHLGTMRIWSLKRKIIGLLAK